MAIQESTSVARFSEPLQLRFWRDQEFRIEKRLRVGRATLTSRLGEPCYTGACSSKIWLVSFLLLLAMRQLVSMDAIHLHYLLRSAKTGLRTSANCQNCRTKCQQRLESRPPRPNRSGTPSAAQSIFGHYNHVSSVCNRVDNQRNRNGMLVVFRSQVEPTPSPWRLGPNNTGQLALFRYDQMDDALSTMRNMVSLRLTICISYLVRTISLSMLVLAESPFAFSIESDFERDVAPLIVQRCLECHSAVDPSGGLDLTRYNTLMQGGDSGLAIDAAVESSLLLKRLSSGEMPPEKNGKSQALSGDEVAVFRSWIASGSKWPESRVLDPFERTNAKRAGRDWWAWQPIVPITTDLASTKRVTIDHLIQQTLADQNLSPAPAADRRTLLRRVYYDLIGLSPTFEEVVTFEQDQSANAYEKVVDGLLESKHFGERWARHWLDLVRFAETNGYERDAVKPNAWRYRDWIIDAINSDMPYDQFVTEQLAGDEIPNRSESSVVATGFLRLGTWDDEPNDPVEYQYDRLEDMVHTTTTAFLAMTVKCARCHDHKFDAIPQADYYRIAAAFWGGPVAHRKREWNGGPTTQELGYDVLGWTDLGREPPALRLLKKGDVHRPLQIVAPGALSGSEKLAGEFAPPPSDAKTSHRRLQLAKWIVDNRNPLTARVIVNRLWQHHFGEGLVRTPDNFGFLGNPPTHPELLDSLAADLMAGDWKLKRIHKSMVMSQAYRQSSVHSRQVEYAKKDAANQYLWRAERRRLDAEQLRDSILQCSGRLDPRMSGPSFKAPISDEALEGLSMKSGAYQASPPEETRRRSIYMFAKRSLAVPMMAVFDSCDTTAPTGRRDISTVAPQALTLLNNHWVHAESKAMAERVIAFETSVDDRVVSAWRIAVVREPTTTEKQASIDYVKNLLASTHDEANAELLAWSALCHTLINTNEFIYAD